MFNWYLYVENLGLIIGLVLGALIALGFIAVTVILYIRKNKLKNTKKGANQGMYI